VDHFNKLTPAQSERLAILAEECGEVVQIVGKILRHGYESQHPNAPQGETNRVLLARELGDVHTAMDWMASTHDFDLEEFRNHAVAKRKRLSAYLHHNHGPATRTL
jgi:NTP pyrophosphatase (non-canonical NTP hydrolase)